MKSDRKDMKAPEKPVRRTTLEFNMSVHQKPAKEDEKVSTEIKYSMRVF